MKFLGAKSRLAAEIISYVEADRAEGEPLWDLCCGAGHISAAASTRGPRFAVDAVPSLVALLDGVERGTWSPPATVTAEDYAELKRRALANPRDPDPLIAFAGFGCSYAGKWYAGFTAPGPCGGLAVYDYAAGARASLLRRAKRLRGVEFLCADWRTLLDQLAGTVYIDPEYAGTTGYRAAPPHDPKSFWWHADAAVERVRQAFVSEFAAPPHWREVAAWPGYKAINKSTRVERLFTR